MQTYERFVTVAQSVEYNISQRHAAFAQLVAQFRGMTLTYAYQVLGDEQLAQDATQDAFLTAYQRLAQLREPAAFPGWLRRIVHTHCHRLTRAKRPEYVPLETVDSAVPVEGDLAQLVADEDAAQAMVDCVMAAVADLPEHERVVVRLFYFEGYSIRDVAAALDVPITTIKKRLQYARNRLRKGLMAHVNHCELTIQSWALQTAQLLLPLFAQPVVEPVLSPVSIPKRGYTP